MVVNFPPIEQENENQVVANVRVDIITQNSN